MNNILQESSRRKFIIKASVAGAAILLNPLISLSFRKEDSVSKIVAETMGIDTHNHIDVPLNKGDFPGPNIDLIGEMKKSGLSAICMTFAVDYQKLTKEDEAYERFINGLDAMDEVLKNNKINRSLNLADLNTAYKNKEATVIQSVEGGHFLEGKIERLENAYNRGLRHLGLLHDNDASVPLGDIYTNPAKYGGLTAFGRDVIKECNRLGILVDLTHCSNDTINAALKLSTKPVIISHTGLDTQLGQNANMAKMMRPRLISKEQAKIVADAGGIIGVWTHLSDSPLEYAKNIRAIVDVVGIEHVCIGTDTKMTPSFRPSNNSNTQHRQDNGNKNEPPHNNEKDKNEQSGDRNSVRIGERTNGAWAEQKEGFYYTVVDALIKTGFNKEEIGKIGGGNFCRVFDAATAGRN